MLTISLIKIFEISDVLSFLLLLGTFGLFILLLLLQNMELKIAVDIYGKKVLKYKMIVIKNKK